MIQDQDQFAVQNRCELCGDPLIEGPPEKDGQRLHTHYYDTPEEQAKYAHKFFTGTRKKNYERKMAATPDAQTALKVAVPGLAAETSKGVSDETANLVLPQSLRAPVDDLRESIIAHASDPDAARAHIEGNAGVQIDRQTKTATFTPRFGGLSSSASQHVDYMTKMLKHPSSPTFYQATVSLKKPYGEGVHHLGSFHIHGVKSGTVDGVQGIHVGDSFYPDEQVHDVSYGHNPTAPRHSSGEPYTQKEQHEWYKKREKDTKSDLNQERQARARREANVAADTDSEGVNVGRAAAAASPAGVSAAGLAAKTRLMDTMVGWDVDTKTAESMHNIMDTRAVDAKSAKHIHELMTDHGLSVDAAHTLHNRMTGKS